MNQSDESYCNKYRVLIEQYFSFLLTQHNYELVFLQRAGRYKNECVFGMQSNGKPKFQFGGETGPYVAIAAPTVPFSLDAEGGAGRPWLFIEALDDFLAGRGAPWISRHESIVWEKKLDQLSEKTVRLLPWLLETFSEEKSVEAWRVEYDKCVKDALAKYLGRTRT
jgi:hypothetical protein